MCNYLLCWYFTCVYAKNMAIRMIYCSLSDILNYLYLVNFGYHQLLVFLVIWCLKKVEVIYCMCETIIADKSSSQHVKYS